MSAPQPPDRQEAIGKLSEEMALALAVSEAIDEQQWAERFALDVAAVRECRRGLEALATSLGEEESSGPLELPQPELPDDFELGDELGRGGMGVVYRARQRSLDREVAIKVLRPGDLVFGDALRRFRAEARSLARLRHRHIVSVYDSGETPEGLMWFTMDLVEGRTLADELRQRKRMMPARAVRILRQVTSAIAHAHAQGIVHRDLKPQNVLIDDEGDAYVVDFGLARDASSHGTRTVTGELLGTPEYMSPEQASGDAGNISEASDVWALGALLYESLSGRGPFSGMPLHETIRAILEDDPTPLQRDKRVPKDLALICGKAMQKRPGDRYTGALAFGEDLERFQDGRGVLAQRPSRVRHMQRLLQRRWRSIAIVAAAVMTTLAAISIWIPTIQRNAVIAQTRQLRESGHADAAIPSLREVLASTPRSASDYRLVQYDLVRALNDRTGDLLLAGDRAGADKLAAEAWQIASKSKDRGGVVPVDELPQWHRWNWEMARATAVHAPEEELDSADFAAKLREDIASELPGRRAMARRVAALGRVPVTELPESLRHEVLLETLRFAARRDDPQRTLLDGFPLTWSGQQMDAWWSPALEDRLAEFALDTSETPATRTVALLAWLQVVGLPCIDSVRGISTTDQNAPTPEQVSGTAKAVIERWRTWHTLPREAAIKARIDLLVEAMQRPNDLLVSNRDQALREALAWTGAPSGLDGAAFASWWSSAKQRPYTEFLRESLGIQANEPVTMRQALDRSATASDPTIRLWRQLAWLQIPDGRRYLACAPEANRGGKLWRASCLDAAEVVDDRELVLRCAILRFDDGAATPELIAHESKSVHIGQPVNVHLLATVAEPPTVSLRTHIWDDDWDRMAPRFVQPNDPDGAIYAPGMGQVTAAIGGEVLLDRDGARFEATTVAKLRQVLPGQRLQDGHASASRTWLGSACSLGGADVIWDSGRRITTFVLLVALHEQAERDEPDLAWWHAACERTFEDAASAGEHSLQQLAADWLTASLWPMPGALASMKHLRRANPTQQDPISAYTNKRVASLLAGGPTSDLNSWPVLSHAPVAAQFVRIAVASASEQVRAATLAGLAKMGDDDWTPRLARTVREANDSSERQLPPALVRSLESQPAPDGFWDTLMHSPSVQLLVVLMVLSWLTGSAVRKSAKPRRTLAAWASIIAWSLLCVRLQIGGVVLTPSFVPLAALWLCAWASGKGPAITWQRVLGLGGLGAFVGWSVSTALFGITPPQGLGLWVAGAAVLAAVPWSERGAAALIARTPRGTKRSR